MIYFPLKYRKKHVATMISLIPYKYIDMLKITTKTIVYVKFFDKINGKPTTLRYFTLPI